MPATQTFESPKEVKFFLTKYVTALLKGDATFMLLTCNVPRSTRQKSHENRCRHEPTPVFGDLRPQPTPEFFEGACWIKCI